MRVMFMTTKPRMLGAVLDEVKIMYARRTMWDKVGHRPVFIIAKSDWELIRLWSNAESDLGIGFQTWWTITGCNKQYITSYTNTHGRGGRDTHTMSNYLGTLASVSSRTADKYTALHPDYLILTDGPLVWIPRAEGSPSRLINEHTNNNKDEPTVSLNWNDPWPVDPAAPKPGAFYGTGMVDQMRYELENIRQATIELADLLEHPDDPAS